MNLIDINPYIRYCSIIISPVSHNDYTKAYDCRLFYIIDGTGTFTIDETVYPFCENTLFLIPSGTRYRFQFHSDKQQLYVLNFDYTTEFCHITKSMKPDFEKEFNLASMIPAPFRQTLFFQNGVEQKTPLLQLYHELSTNSPESAALSSALLKQVLVRCHAATDTPASDEVHTSLASRISAFLNAHHTENAPNTTVAAHFGYNSYYLNRVFKSATGTTMHQYLIECRIKTAQKLLATSGLTIEEIAKVSGFKTQSQFSQTFKKFCGKTPTAYRAQSGIAML